MVVDLIPPTVYLVNTWAGKKFNKWEMVTFSLTPNNSKYNYTVVDILYNTEAKKTPGI